MWQFRANHFLSNIFLNLLGDDLNEQLLVKIVLQCLNYVKTDLKVFKYKQIIIQRSLIVKVLLKLFYDADNYLLRVLA